MDGNALVADMLSGKKQAQPDAGRSIVADLLSSVQQQPQARSLAASDLAGMSGEEQAAAINELRRAGMIQTRPPEDMRNIGRAGALGGGAMMGAMDETMGALSRVLPELTSRKPVTSEDADFNQLTTQDEIRQSVEELPFGERLALELAGGLAWAPVAGLAPAARSTPGMIATSTAGGAGLGLASGFASGEGGLTGRLDDAAVGTAVGGTVGFAVPALITAVKKIGSGAVSALSRAERTAYQRAIEAFEADKITPQDAARMLNDWAQTGKPVMLADVGGENVRNLLDVAATNPGGRNAVSMLEARGAEATQRVKADVSDLLDNGASFAETKRILSDVREKEASSLYEKAWAANVSDKIAEKSDDLRKIINTPFGQRALKAAEEMALNKKLGSLGDLPPMQQLHILKMAMDDVLETASKRTDDSSIGKTRKRDLAQLLDEYRNILFDINPDYKMAAKQFGGRIEVEEAADMGLQVFRERPDELAYSVASMSESAKEGFRLGVARAVLDKIEGAKDGADAVKRFFTSETWRETLRPAFRSDAEFREFTKRMRIETEMRATQDRMKNSSTAKRLTGQELLTPDTPMLDAFSGAVKLDEPLTGLRNLFGPARAKVEEIGRRNTAEALSDLLTQASIPENDRKLAEAMMLARQRLRGVNAPISPLLSAPVPSMEASRQIR